MQDQTRENAHRIATALFNRAEDPGAINRLSIILDYHPEQLQRDMKDLIDYICRIEAQR